MIESRAMAVTLTRSTLRAGGARPPPAARPRRSRAPAAAHGAPLLVSGAGPLAPLTGLAAGALHVATGPGEDARLMRRAARLLGFASQASDTYVRPPPPPAARLDAPRESATLGMSTKRARTRCKCKKERGRLLQPGVCCMPRC